jgi:carboxypeptidase C (cathepsin A)
MMSLPNKLRFASITLLMAITSASPQLHHPTHYEVDRHLLEKGYPAFKSFKGSMHAGLIPAVSLDDKKKDVDDYSEYFFWLFRPDGDGEKGKPESFRDDTLLIWLNGGPGCSSMVGAMTENGPVTIPKFGPGIPPPNPASALNAPLVENPYAWTKKISHAFC